MTIRTLYRPTRLDRQFPRGPLIVSAAVVAWLAFVLVGYGLLSVLS
jgi:hypothetical protein